MIQENFNIGNNVRNAVGLSFDPTTKQKKATRRLFKKLGEEDQFTGICAKCSWVGVLAKKNLHNSHYGCTDYCCPLLHQWNVCDDCLAETRKKFNPIRYSDRHFQRVFSRLPDDVQRYIGEFVPHVFAFVKMSGQLFRAARLFYNIDRHSRLLGSLWKESFYFDYQLTHFSGKVIYKNSSGKEICRCLKQHYRFIYRTYYLREEVRSGLYFSVDYNNSNNKFMLKITELLSSV
jgi:hypothetical protein